MLPYSDVFNETKKAILHYYLIPMDFLVYDAL